MPFEEYVVYHPKFIEWMKVKGLEVKRNLTPEEIEDLVKQSPYYKATSADVDWVEKSQNARCCPEMDRPFDICNYKSTG